MSGGEVAEFDVRIPEGSVARVQPSVRGALTAADQIARLESEFANERALSASYRAELEDLRAEKLAVSNTAISNRLAGWRERAERAESELKVVRGLLQAHEDESAHEAAGRVVGDAVGYRRQRDEAHEHAAELQLELGGELALAQAALEELRSLAEQIGPARELVGAVAGETLAQALDRLLPPPGDRRPLGQVAEDAWDCGPRDLNERFERVAAAVVSAWEARLGR